MKAAYSYIRFSSPDQEKGDSLRRQIEQSEAYAQAHGLTLDNSLRLTDRGLSAYHGVHRTRGALAEFLRLADNGEIEPGSVLLVESLDRLSREQVLDALTQFTGIIRAGIKVVTLADKMEYDRESINGNFGQLLMSLVIMSRAHEESAIKAMRLSAAWDNKRKEAMENGRKMSAKCPGWLTISDDKQKFVVIPEAAEAVNLIFQMRLEGKGSELIAKTLNKTQDVWRFSTTKHSIGYWRKSYIDKILRNPAVIGYFQPRKKIKHEKKEGKFIYVPIGDPIPDYFPQVVPKEAFDRVQAIFEENSKIRGHAGGKNGAAHNLFRFIGKCAYCGAPMVHVIVKHHYLACDRARRGLGCSKKYVRYDLIEPMILKYCKGLDPSTILPGNEKVKSELVILRNQLRATEGELVQVRGKIGNLLDSLELGGAIKDRLKVREEEKASLEAQRVMLMQQISEKESVSQDTEKQLKSVQELIDKMAELTGQDRIDLRLNLRGHLRQLISQINIYPDKTQLGIIFKTGERRLLTLGRETGLLDVVAKAKKVPVQIWEKPRLFYKPQTSPYKPIKL